MTLRYRFNAKEEIPVEHQALYTEREGAWLLDVEGLPSGHYPGGHYSGFRPEGDLPVGQRETGTLEGKLTALQKERDELMKRFDGIDPDQVRALAEEKRKLEEAAQLKAGEVEKVIDGRIRSVKGDLEKQIAALSTERELLNARLTTIQIDQGVVASASERGLTATAIPDITARARNVFKLVDGVPRAFAADGQTVLQGKKGPMSVEEWVTEQVKEAPHLFGRAAGGGSAPVSKPNGNGSGSGSHGGKNPFKRATWNLTEQMRILKADPELGERLRAEA